MNLTAISPKFSGHSERTNPVLKGVKEGDQLVLTKIQSVANGGPWIRKSELVTVVSVEPHHGKEVHGVSVPSGVLNENENYRTEIGNDYVDQVTFRHENGQKESALYGTYYRNTVYKPSNTISRRAPINVHQTGTDGRTPFNAEDGVRYNKVINVPHFKEGFELKPVSTFVTETTDELNQYDTAHHDLAIKQSGVNELIEALTKAFKK